MAVVNTLATAVTNADSVNPQTNNKTKLAEGRVKTHVGTVEAANGDSIGSTYRLARVYTGWRIDQVKLACDAITTCAGDVGVYDVASAGGAVIDADFFASAQSLASAIGFTDVTHESAVYGIEDVEQSLGTALGLSADKWVDIAVTLTAAAASAGTVSLKVYAVDGN